MSKPKPSLFQQPLDVRITRFELKLDSTRTSFIIPAFTLWSEIYPTMPVCGSGIEWPDDIDVFIDRDEDGIEVLIDLRSRPIRFVG